MNKDLRDYFAKIGAKGGKVPRKRSLTPAKAREMAKASALVRKKKS